MTGDDLIESREESITTKEELFEKKEVPVAVVGSTVVAGPEVLKTIDRAIGSDGTGIYETHKLLIEIAKRGGSFDELEVLAEKNTKDSEYNASGQRLLEVSQYMRDYLQAAVQKNLGVDARKNLWVRDFAINGEPYTVANLGKKQADFIHTAFNVHQKGKKHRYHFGDTVIASGVQIGGENRQQSNAGTMEERLAAIVDSAREYALDDFTLDANNIEVFLINEKGFTNGRLCVEIGKSWATNDL